MIKSLLVVGLLAAVLATACGGEVATEEEAKPEACSAEFMACRADKASSTLCIDGNCACAPPTHPGQNSAVSCFTGEPDVGW